MARFTEDEFKQMTDQKPKPRKRGGRGHTKQGTAGQSLIDSGKGTLTECQDCGAVYDETEQSAPEPRNKRQWIEIQHGVEWHKFRCFCGFTYDRYQ